MLYLCFGSIILFQKWLKWRTCNSINRPSILIDCWHLSVLFKVNMYSVDVYFLFFPLQLVYSNWEGMIFSLLLSRLLASFLQILLSLENWKTAITFNLKNSTKPWTSRSALVLKKNVPTFFFHWPNIMRAEVGRIWVVPSCDDDRPDTSRRQRRRLPPCPLVIALVPSKWSSTNLQFHHRVPFTKKNMPWCPCPFNSEAYRPVMINNYSLS